MKTRAYKKGFVIGVIILFVGLGFQPVFAVENRVNIDNIEMIEDCECQEVDSQNLVRVKLLMNNLKFFTNILIKRFGHIPEVKEKCQEVVDLISSSSSFSNPIIICLMLYFIVDNLYYLQFLCSNKFVETGRFIYLIIIEILDVPWLTLCIISYYLECFWLDPY
jgi:hypothetical protein